MPDDSYESDQYIQIYYLISITNCLFHSEASKHIKLAFMNSKN